MKTITKFCKQNRRNLTPAERALRSWLLKIKPGTPFRTQRPFDFYIVDFLFPLKRIAVEVDGEYHNSNSQKLKDEKRTRYLESKGLTIIRITNEQVFSSNLSWLKERIESAPDHDLDWKQLYGQSAY